MGRFSLDVLFEKKPPHPSSRSRSSTTARRSVNNYTTASGARSTPLTAPSPSFPSEAAGGVGAEPPQMRCASGNTADRHEKNMSLYDLLLEAQLQQYFYIIESELKVTNLSQARFIGDDDLESIGMSRPEQKRFKYYYEKANKKSGPLARMRKAIFSSGGSLKSDYTSWSLPRRRPTEKKQRDAEQLPASVGCVGRAPKPHEGSSPSLVADSDLDIYTGNRKYIIPSSQIQANITLGTGEFGVVKQGIWTTENGNRLQVAVKIVAADKLMSGQAADFIKEAGIMHSLEHRHLCKMYGLVIDNSLMLITELAPLRSLGEGLKDPSLKKSFTIPVLCKFAEQICCGMQYLEEKRLIHRDLAARNILIFDKNLVKVSDFGLSRALGAGKDYYQTNYNVNLRLPIAWCAPECINYLKFTTASDVWAYGVTLWEMFSYGFQPWAGLTGNQIIQEIDHPLNRRLEQPECCPTKYYQSLMLHCWHYDVCQRPTFAEIAKLLPQLEPQIVYGKITYHGSGNSSDGTNELSFRVGDPICVLEERALALWKGVLMNGQVGCFMPSHTTATFDPNKQLQYEMLLRNPSQLAPRHSLACGGPPVRDGDIFFPSRGPSATSLQLPQADFSSKRLSRASPAANLQPAADVPKQVVRPFNHRQDSNHSDYYDEDDDDPQYRGGDPDGLRPPIHVTAAVDSQPPGWLRSRGNVRNNSSASSISPIPTTSTFEYQQQPPADQDRSSAAAAGNPTLAAPLGMQVISPQVSSTSSRPSMIDQDNDQQCLLESSSSQSSRSAGGSSPTKTGSFFKKITRSPFTEEERAEYANRMQVPGTSPTQRFTFEETNLSQNRDATDQPTPDTTRVDGASSRQPSENGGTRTLPIIRQPASTISSYGSPGSGTPTARPVSSAFERMKSKPLPLTPGEMALRNTPDIPPRVALVETPAPVIPPRAPTRLYERNAVKRSNTSCHNRPFGAKSAAADAITRQRSFSQKSIDKQQNLMRNESAPEFRTGSTSSETEAMKSPLPVFQQASQIKQCSTGTIQRVEADSFQKSSGKAPSFHQRTQSNPVNQTNAAPPEQDDRYISLMDTTSDASGSVAQTDSQTSIRSDARATQSQNSIPPISRLISSVPAPLFAFTSTPVNSKRCSTGSREECGSSIGTISEARSYEDLLDAKLVADVTSDFESDVGSGSFVNQGFEYSTPGCTRLPTNFPTHLLNKSRSFNAGDARRQLARAGEPMSYSYDSHLRKLGTQETRNKNFWDPTGSKGYNNEDYSVLKRDSSANSIGSIEEEPNEHGHADAKHSAKPSSKLISAIVTNHKRIKSALKQKHKSAESI